MSDPIAWIGGDSACRHTSCHVLGDRLKSCTRCGAVGVANDPPSKGKNYTQSDLYRAAYEAREAALREAADAVDALIASDAMLAATIKDFEDNTNTAHMLRRKTILALIDPPKRKTASVKGEDR